MASRVPRRMSRVYDRCRRSTVSSNRRSRSKYRWRLTLHAQAASWYDKVSCPWQILHPSTDGPRAGKQPRVLPELRGASSREPVETHLVDRGRVPRPRNHLVDLGLIPFGARVSSWARDRQRTKHSSSPRPSNGSKNKTLSRRTPRSVSSHEISSGPVHGPDQQAPVDLAPPSSYRSVLRQPHRKLCRLRRRAKQTRSGLFRRPIRGMHSGCCA